MLSPTPTKKSINLIAKLLKLNNWLVWALAILFTLQPTALLAAEANTPFATIDCPALANEEIKEDQISAVGVDLIHNINNDLLKGLLIGKSLHYRLRCSPLITGLDEIGKSTVSAYNVAKNIVNFGVLIILLVIAFANILRIKLDTYAVKKAVPLLLFGVVMANLGLPIIRTIVDFSEVITATFIHQASEDGTKTGFVKELINAVYRGGVGAVGTAVNQLNSGGSGFWSAALALVGIAVVSITATGPFAVIIIVGGAFLIFLPSIMFLILGLMFVARIYFIVLLAAVSPIAFASLGFEPLRGKVWGWWWTHFIKWTFMVPISFGLFWLGIVFSRSVGNTMDLGTYVLVLFLIYQATQIPLKLGGTVMSAWNNGLVKPISGLINKPFTAAREYVSKAAPRDVSRFLSSPPEWLARRLPGKTLNYARYTKEALAQIEARNAQREASSNAVRGGKMAGQFINSFDTIPQAAKGLKNGGYQKYAAEAIQTAEGKKAILDLVKTSFRHMPNPAHKLYGDYTPDEQEKFNKTISDLRNSGDREKIQAAILANATYGRQLGDKEREVDKNDPDQYIYYREKLDKMSGSSPENIRALERIYKDILDRKLNRPTLGFDQAGNQEAINNLAHQIRVIATNTRDTKKIDELFTSIDSYLKKNLHELETLEELQRDSNKLAYVRGTLEAADAGSESARKIAGNHKLDRFRDGLNITAPGELSAIFAGSAASNEHIRALAMAFQGNGFADSDQLVREVNNSATINILNTVWSDKVLRGKTKDYMRSLLERALNNTFRDPSQKVEKETLTKSLISELISDDINDAPKLLAEPDLIKFISDNHPDLNITGAQIKELSSHLSTYRAGAQTLNTLKKGHDDAKTRIAQQTAASADGGGTGSGAPPSP